jgi:hypothetical protein
MIARGPMQGRWVIEEFIQSYRDVAGASAPGGGTAEPHLS